MDTEFARTFLAVADAGSFIAAAKGLHVTQSTVSGRIQALEEQLGCRLFTRDRSGAALTGAGRRFYKYAVLLVQAVEQAREEMALSQNSPARLTIGARASLWDGLLIDWIAELRRAAPDISFHARVGLERDLMQEMTDGPVDLAVMYAPQARAHLEMLRLTEEPLVL